MRKVRRKVVVTVLAIAIFSSIMLSSILGASAKPMFKDDFSSGKMKDWNVVYGTWTVQDKKLTQNYATTNPDFDWSHRPTVVADVFVSNSFRIETMFMMRSGGYGSSAILFRYQDIRNSLFVIFHQGTYIVIGNAIDGVEDNVGYPFSFALDTEHMIRIDVNGPAIDVYVNGVLAASNPTLGSAYSSGKVGFHTTGTAVTYDDVLVSGDVQKALEEKAKVLFKDDFNSRQLSHWDVAYGTWTVQDKKLTQADIVEDHRWSFRPTIVTDVVVSDKFRIETMLTMKSGGYGSTAILFKYQDIENSIFVVFHQGVAIIINRAIDGIEPGDGLGAWYPFVFSYDTEYQVRIDVRGSVIDVYVDGVFVARNSVLGSAFSSGRVGFHTCGTAVAYDDVVISELQ